MIAVTERKMLMYSLLGDMSLISTYTETSPITSISLDMASCASSSSAGGDRKRKGEVLVNLSTQEIHLWDLDEGRSIRRFAGFKQVCTTDG